MSTPTPHPSSAQREHLARVTWSLLAEPSDAMALHTCALLGASEALALVRRGTPSDLARVIGDTLPRDATEAASPDRGERSRLALERWRRRAAGLDVSAVIDAAAERGIRTLVPGEEEWPARLADLQESAPHCLWLSGPGHLADLLEPPSLALVGSRASTPYGEDTATSLGAGLAARSGTVVSGGAYGIDAAAHRGALAPEGGATVAVLAGGLDRLYPRGNSQLLREIRSRHLLLGEAPPGTAPTRWRFLARNRLIAALSGAVVVVEASWRSGALNTARHADELSRPVGAVPGPVSSAASAGCHRLLRERGAVLVTDLPEALELLGDGTTGERPRVQDELDLLDPVDRRVLDAVPPRSAATPEQLARETGIDPDRVEAAVARLSLLGLVEEMGERVRRGRR